MFVVGRIDNPYPHREAFPLHEALWGGPEVTLESVIECLKTYVEAEGFHIFHPVNIRARDQRFLPPRADRPRKTQTWYHRQTGEPVKVLAILEPPRPWAVPWGRWSLEPCYVVDTGNGETWTVPEETFKSLFRKSKPRPKKEA